MQASKMGFLDLNVELAWQQCLAIWAGVVNHLVCMKGVTELRVVVDHELQDDGSLRVPADCLFNLGREPTPQFNRNR